VGWNTKLDGTSWVPTFPNATYLIPQRDCDYFRPENAERIRPPRTEDEKRRFAGSRLVFTDSIAPIAESGQLQTWAGEHHVDDVLRLQPTPGSSVAWLETGRGAVFAGDLIHTPAQIGRPDDPCAFDLDPGAARASRRNVLGAAAWTGATLFPAHFAGAAEPQSLPKTQPSSQWTSGRTSLQYSGSGFKVPLTAGHQLTSLGEYARSPLWLPVR
jgi:glyoxylase-like metal-dependent hydrolase (beta-lactamase superfamily II)